MCSIELLENSLVRLVIRYSAARCGIAVIVPQLWSRVLWGNHPAVQNESGDPPIGCLVRRQRLMTDRIVLT